MCIQVAALSKLPPFRHPIKGGMALERTHVPRKKAEADGAAAVAVVDTVDRRRQFLAPVSIGRKQVRLMLAGGHQVEQHHADAQRFVPRDPVPELLEAGEQKAGVVGLAASWRPQAARS